MKPDGMLVDPTHITTAFQDVSNRGGDETLAELATTEPALAALIAQHLAAVAGKLALSGAPNPVVMGLHADVLAAVLTSVQALRRGHYQLWRDTMTGTRLALLDNVFKAPRKGRRKKDNEAGPTE
jgi:hypothetical protein